MSAPTISQYAGLEALKNGEIIIFGDEVHVQQGHGIRSYARKGKRSIIVYHQANKHTDRTVFTVLGLNGFSRIFCLPGPFDSGYIIDCLKKLKSENEGVKFLLILDNAHVHTSSKVKKWSNRKNGGRGFIRIAWLPEYSPEINPVEYFNNYLKSYLKRFAASSSEEVIDIVYTFIADFREKDPKEKSELVKKFFNSRDCRFTIETYEKMRKAC